ncbi:MAG: bifunctional diaminohydroxyphosphoribosylaminopyrimidine deaminase/5-amino-6-(5-phosphoribosylamino)uracil reductase RibD [Bacteroidota bacterium]
MNSHDKYINRCLELAQSGLGYVAPNPMVGCVIVHNDEIIGEGFHRVYGGFHAEVNAINSVKDAELLKKSSIYVNLEPCSHYGKTSPCAELIIQHKIPKVIVGSTDPHVLVGGKGIEMLRNAGCEVITGVLEKDCIQLNKRFFTFHIKKRPYIILKWAQTLDGFIDIDRNITSNQNSWISNDALKRLVHLWRTQEQSILVGYNTALVDNPQLNVRIVSGKNPLRVVYDPKNKLPPDLHLFDGSTPTLLICNKNQHPIKDNAETEIIPSSSEAAQNILEVLYKKNIQSVIIEGGKNTLEMFIRSGLWDEALILVGNKTFGRGLQAPVIQNTAKYIEDVQGDKIMYIENPLQSLT